MVLQLGPLDGVTMAGVELFDPEHPTKDTMLGDTDGRWPPRSSRSSAQQLFQCEGGAGVFVQLADMFVDEQMGGAAQMGGGPQQEMGGSPPEAIQMGGGPPAASGEASGEPEMAATEPAPFTVQPGSRVFVRPVRDRILAAATLSV